MCAVVEFLLKSEMTKEIDGRKFDDDNLWETLANCETELSQNQKRNGRKESLRNCKQKKSVGIDYKYVIF